MHSKEKEDALDKAKDIIRMSVARAAHLAPLKEFDLPVNKEALVVGGGIAGMTCALSIANQGHEVHLLEKESNLGGMALKIHETLEGLDVQAYLRDLIKKVYATSVNSYLYGRNNSGSGRLRGEFHHPGEVRKGHPGN